MKLSAIPLTLVKKMLHLVTCCQRVFGGMYESYIVHTYESTYITETSTKLSWTLIKVDENEFNMIEKYICTAYDLHNRFRTSNVNRLQFLLFPKSSDNKLKTFPNKRGTAALYFTFGVRCR